MSPQQASDLKDLLAAYWKKKGQGKSTRKTLDELTVLLAQIGLMQWKIIMETDPDDVA